MKNIKQQPREEESLISTLPWAFTQQKWHAKEAYLEKATWNKDNDS